MTDSSTPSRSSISVTNDTKSDFDTIRRQFSAIADDDMTGTETLDMLIRTFEQQHSWADTDADLNIGVGVDADTGSNSNSE